MLKRIKEKLNFAGKKNMGRNAGFSLIEVIAVTIIIGVMATMLMPAIDGAGSKARNAKLKNDLATLDQAIATYKLEQGSIPASLDNLVLDCKSYQIHPTKRQFPVRGQSLRTSCPE